MTQWKRSRNVRVREWSNTLEWRYVWREVDDVRKMVIFGGCVQRQDADAGDDWIFPQVTINSCLSMGPEGGADLVRLLGFYGYGMNTVPLRKSPTVDVCWGMPQQWLLNVRPWEWALNIWQLFPTEVSSFDFQVECTDRTEQCKFNAQSLRLFGLHSDVNDTHRAGANRMDESIFLEEIRTWEHPPWYGIDQFKEKVTINFLGESEGSLPPPHDSFPDAGEAINDFWSMSGNFIYRHHVEPRVKLCTPREESFPIPLKYIDVSRTTHTNLDVKQEKRIDDYWNVDGSRDLDPWTGFTQCTLLEEKPPDAYMWSGRRLTKKQVTSRPDHLWPDLWIKLGKNAKLKEKQKWSHEKLHLDNARRLRGILFHWPWG